MHDSVMTRFFGGSPLTVAVRLVVVSLLVGLVMTWLQIDPIDIFLDLQRGFVRIWGTGFVALHQMGNTILAGAAVVLPVWFILRRLELPRAAILGSAAPAGTAAPMRPVGVGRWTAGLYVRQRVAERIAGSIRRRSESGTALDLRT